MTAQAALWNWGKSGKLGIIFFMDLGMWGFRARASVFSGQMATVLASVLASLRPHPSPTSSPPRACAHVPARPLRCPDWAAWGGGPAHTGGRLRAGVLVGPQRLAQGWD